MITDNDLRLATAEVTPNGGAAPGGLGAASVTLALDPGGSAALPAGLLIGSAPNQRRSYGDIGGGKRVSMAINVDTAFTCATFGATLELQLVSLPIDATKLVDATTSGKLLTIPLVVTNSTTDELSYVGSASLGTLNGHNLPLGTPIFLTSIVTTTGISASTIYYVVPTSANAFKLATSLPNAIAGTTINLATGNGTATVNFIPTVHGSTGTLPLYNAGVPTNQGPLRAGQRLMVPLKPLASLTPDSSLPTGQTFRQPYGAGPVSGLLAANAQRFFYLRYVPSNTITAGAVTVDLIQEAEDSLKVYPTAFENVG